MECPDCGGTGRVVERRPSSNPYHLEPGDAEVNEVCPDCEGTGERERRDDDEDDFYYLS